MNSETRDELAALTRFAKENLRANGTVNREIQKLIEACGSDDPRLFPLHVKMSSHPEFIVIVGNTISMLELKDVIEYHCKSMDSSVLDVKVMRIQNTAKTFDKFDDSTIRSAGIRPNDILNIELSSTSSMSVNNCEGVLASSAVSNHFNYAPQSNLETMSLVWHDQLLSGLFICQYEGQSTVPGFAPSLRDLPNGAFLPPNWNKSAEVIAFKYRVAKRPGQQFALKITAGVGYADVWFGVTGKGTKGVAAGSVTSQRVLMFDNYPNSALDMQRDEMELQAFLRDMIHEVAPDTPAQPQVSSSSSSSSSPAMCVDSCVPFPEPRESLPAPPLPGSSHASQPVTNMTMTMGYETLPPPRVGNGDLDPFNSYHPGFSGDERGHLPQGTGSGTGSLVGPDHPIFNNQPVYHPRSGDFNSYIPGAVPYDPDPCFPGTAAGPFGGIPGLPQPRIDPFGPVAGSNGPNLADPFGQGGREPRMGRGGRVFGEPNPDHLRPPQEDQNDFI